MGAHTIARGLKSEQGAEPPGPLTLTTVSYQISTGGVKKYFLNDLKYIYKCS